MAGTLHLMQDATRVDSWSNARACICCLQAYTPWQNDPKATLGKCLDNMGIDVDSVTAVHKVVLPYLGTMTAVVMRAGDTGVFVSFR